MVLQPGCLRWGAVQLNVPADIHPLLDAVTQLRPPLLRLPHMHMSCVTTPGLWLGAYFCCHPTGHWHPEHA